MSKSLQNICTVASEFGRLGLVEEDGRITHLLWHASEQGERSHVLIEAAQQLKAYLAGKLDTFDLPLAPAGTEFQRQVYDAMLAIPKGRTRSYGDIAKDLGVPAQPVGQACGSNPIPIIIPCHRVVGGNGLGGFSGSGGVETKIKLLQFEGAYALLL
ncbi:MAG: methylated-DNA--[protein]-cysteine S-methyltransferase [Hyphomicrobiaceae bacterium]